MVTWGNSYFVIGPVIGLIYLILQFLIKKHNIKPNKVSRIFYEDDESFIKSWKKIREKGMLRYTIKTTIIVTAILVIIATFLLLNEFSLYDYEQQMLFIVSKMGMLGLLISLFLWCVKSFRYSELED
ncbi:hypothetical protein [Clostridium sp.]|uniref:hypothetical protein n=1 Tax=Clostridium sp. TaxID=1506 RepID=UPI001A458E3B|nr:hypothetical protein [Clostridium sp.]MBK5236104.1 hypothetical protein [Clostridium sp.]